MVPISQAQSFGDIHLEGQGNTLTINQIIQIAVAEIKTRDFIPSSPYIGLQPFGENNKDAFFGRDQLVGKLLRLVSQHNLVLLAGASGSGKSSVVRAGLLPQLNARLDQGRFNALTFTPDRDPFQSLRGALNTAAGVPQEDLDGLEARTAESLVTTLTSQRPADVLWLLFIDQFEQIFTRCADAEQREAFILGLTRLAQSSQSEIKIVLAMRADFFDRFGPYPEFGALAQEGIQLALDMQASELRAAIEQPAARHGVVFEEGLVEQIIASIKDRPGTLPLLQYTLDLLWREDKPENDRTLNTNSYLRIGGIEGALKQRADAIYRFAKAKKQIERSPAQREALRQIFLHVVDLTSPGAEAHAVSRRTSLDAFPRAEDRQLISELVDEKLLVSNAPLPDKNGQPSRSATIEVAHEALLSAWPLLKDWIEQAREVIYVRNRLAADARRFVEVTACTPALAADELWVGTRLAQALELRACGDFRTLLGGLCPEEESFLDASEARKARLEREATEQLRREREAAEKNRQLLLDSYIDRGHQLLFDKGDPYAAALWLHRAYKQESQNPILPHLLKTAMQHVDVTRAVLSGHQDRVTSARFSPDGRRIVTASDDNTARIWDGEIGRMLIELRGHENRVISVRFGPNGQRILTASLDRTARLWDPESGFLLATLVGHKHAVVDALFSLDGRRILTFSADPIVSPQQDHSAMIWDAEGQLLGELISPQSSIVLARFSPDGQRIFTLSYDGAVRIWDVESGRVLTEFRCPDGPITSASYSPDGQRIIIGIPTFTSRAQLRNAEDGKLVFELIDVGLGLLNLRFSPDGLQIVTASESGKAQLWDAREGRLQADLAGRDARFSLDGRRIVTTMPDRRAAVWEAESGRLLAIYAGHGGTVSSVAFSPDGRCIVTASNDGTARLWGAVERGPLAKLINPEGGILGAMFRLDGLRIVTTGDDNVARLWDAKSGQQLAKLRSPGRNIVSAMFSPDCLRVVTADKDNTVSLWDAETGKQLDEIAGYGGSPVKVELSFDGRRIVTIGRDNIMRVWDIERGRLLAKLTESQSRARNATFSPDGQRIVAASTDGTAQIWSVEDGRLLVELKGHQDMMVSAKYSSDGRRIVTASWDGTARVWQAESGLLLAEITGHTRKVWTATFSSDGRRIVTGDDDTARIWDAENGRLLAKIAGQRGRVLAAMFSPDDQLILTIGTDKIARIWNASPETRSPEELARVIRCRSHVRFEPEDGNVIVPCSPLSSSGNDSVVSNS